jgi:membrane protease YdiL (CAAX protease family)
MLYLVSANLKSGREETKRAKNTDQEIMSAAFYAKFYYASAEFPTLVGRSGQPHAFDRATFHQWAVTMSQRLVSADPSADNLRRMIAISYPKDSPKLVAQLLKTKEFTKEPSRMSAEARMWSGIYISTGKLTQKDIDDYSSTIDRMHIGWYKHLVAANLQSRAGNASGAKRELHEATRATTPSVVALMIFGMIFALSLPIGLVLCLIFLGRKSGGLPSAPPESIATEPISKTYVAGYLIEIFIAYLCFYLLTHMVLPMILRPRVGAHDPVVLVVITAVAYLLWGLCSIGYLYYRFRDARWSLRLIGLTTHSVARDALWGIGGYIAAIPLMFGAGVLSHILTKSVQTPSNPIVPMLLKSDSLLARLTILFLASIAAPFVEEIFFRGVLFSGLRARWRGGTAIVVSGIIFALLHPLPSDFLPIFVLGAAFAVLRHQRGSLIPGMIAHCIHNSAAFLIMLMLIAGSS